MSQRLPIRSGGTSAHSAAEGRRSRVSGASDLLLSSPVRADSAGRLTIKPSLAVADLADGSTDEEIIAKINELMGSLRENGLVTR